MNLSEISGSITKGKLANFIITKPINSYKFIPYNFGQNTIYKVFISGKEVIEK